MSKKKKNNITANPKDKAEEPVVSVEIKEEAKKKESDSKGKDFFDTKAYKTFQFISQLIIIALLLVHIVTPIVYQAVAAHKYQQSTQGTTSSSANTIKFTAEQFEKITLGGNLKDTIKQIGHDYTTKQKATAMSDDPNDTATEYIFSNPDNSGFSLIVYKDVVVGKYSSGLVKATTKVATESLDSINPGMSEADVEAIIGKGQVQSDVTLNGTSSKVVLYKVSDNTWTFVFQDGVLASMNQESDNVTVLN